MQERRRQEFVKNADPCCQWRPVKLATCGLEVSRSRSRSMRLLYSSAVRLKALAAQLVTHRPGTADPRSLWRRIRM